MTVRDIRLLGDPVLYQICDPISQAEGSTLISVIKDLHDTLMVVIWGWAALRVTGGG